MPYSRDMAGKSVFLATRAGQVTFKNILFLVNFQLLPKCILFGWDYPHDGRVVQHWTLNILGNKVSNLDPGHVSIQQAGCLKIQATQRAHTASKQRRINVDAF